MPPPQDVVVLMTESTSLGFQAKTRKMESFVGPWPTPPMRRLLRAQRRREGWHAPLSSQKAAGLRSTQTAAPEASLLTRLPSSPTTTIASSSRNPAGGAGHDDNAATAAAADDDNRLRRLVKMDPSRSSSIIGPACVALMSSVGRTVADVTNFIRRCRSARADLSAITRELSELQMVLELLNDYGQGDEVDDRRHAVPVELQSHLRPILTNCTTVVLRIDGVLRHHGEGDGPPKWTPEGKREINGLQNSLEVHRGALGLISDLISITIARAARNEGRGEPQGEQLQIHEVVGDLQTVMSSILVSDNNATLARQHFALQVHLGQIIAYAQMLDKADTDTDAWDEAVRRNVSSERKANSHLTTSGKDSGEVPHLTVGGSSPDAYGFPVVTGPDSVSPLTCRDLTATKQTANTLRVTGQGSEPISPLSLDKPASVEATEQASTTIDAHTGVSWSIRSDKEVVPDALLAPATIMRQKNMAAGKASTAGSFHEDEEITEEALAFAQVPVHIMGRLSLNLVGHVYTNKSCLSAGSDGTSFKKSFSTIATAEEEMGDAETEGCAEGYAHSTATSDTGSLRDGDLQFSQMDVTQMPSHEAQPEEKSPVQPPTEYESPQLPSHQMIYQQPSHELREQQSLSTMNTMNTQSFLQGKPLPRPPLEYITGYPGPFTRKKVVVVGNLSCGKTCLITRMSRGTYPKNNTSQIGVTETVKVAVDEEPVELSLWDIRGIDYDPSWLHGAQVALVCFSVNIGSTDAKGKHLGRWVTEVNRNCPTAAILLVGLKSDIRWHAKTVEKLRKHGKTLVTLEQGEQLRESIGAVRYLECSARTGEGVLDVLEETTRVALQVRNEDTKKGHRRPLSRIGRFFGLGHRESGSQ
ncbi:GTP-binding protein rhoA [Cytospora mali]|uniref:GTP-binding protein rhoA n=1 Tax=Cytospora mali TaxID=578113 RepID=A0A194W4F4_CYTMA|nr:GTP-binding protein rhoA [Valsa mali]